MRGASRIRRSAALKEVAFSGRLRSHFDFSFVHVPLLTLTKRNDCIKLNSVCETTPLPSRRAGKRTAPVCEPERLPTRCVALRSEGRGVLNASRILVRRPPPRQQESEGWVAHAQGTTSPPSGRNGCFQDARNRLRTWLAGSAIDESFVTLVPIAVPVAV
jgi:hypothetical protein